MCHSALGSSEANIGAVTGSLKTVMRGECWRQWATPEGKEVSWNPADFRLFLESPRPSGCQTRIDFVRWAVRGSGIEDDFEDLIRGTPGGANNPTPAQQPMTGKFAPTVNRDNVTVDGAPMAIPLSPDIPRPRVRDYTREAPTGNSVSYAIRRLKKEAPELAEKVIKGDLSAYAASVQAGFKDRQVTVPVDHRNS